MKKINDAQGRLYESLNIHMTQLAATFEKMVKHENSEKGPEEKKNLATYNRNCLTKSHILQCKQSRN